MEEKESTGEHEECECAKRKGEVSPAFVVGAPAAWFAWCGDGAGEEFGIAAIAWDQAPSDFIDVSLCQGRTKTLSVILRHFRTHAGSLVHQKGQERAKTPHVNFALDSSTYSAKR